ncbi:hypothetical protein ES703_32908 [subsurface metagenome]
MNLTFYSTKDYENQGRLRPAGKQTQSKPMSKIKASGRTGVTAAQIKSDRALLFCDCSMDECHSCESRNPDVSKAWIPHQVRNDSSSNHMSQTTRWYCHLAPFPINNFHFSKTRAVLVIPAKAGIQMYRRHGFRIKCGAAEGAGEESIKTDCEMSSIRVSK